MAEILANYIPNVLNNQAELLKSIKETLIMVSVSGIISLVIGILIGVLLVVTKKGNILENRTINNIFDKAINIFRSIPFIILLAGLIPLTRIIVGTGIGTKGAIVPLVFGTVPFFARQIETALFEVDKGVIEAAQAMGSGPWDIIFRVYLRESLPGIIRGVTITFVSLIGLSAMAGFIGGGGLGDFAIRYGYQRNMIDITYVTIIIILIMVSIGQGLGNLLIKKITH
ncbi:MAG: ABC transporter permease [Tissierellia bacterium]|jgi:D-methionine transport system permease protein|nr:ABC transporter permease [Tissierellia bacterium]